MRVLVCGGRGFNDEAKLFAVLDEAKPGFVIEGGAPGADTLAWRWAKRNLSTDQRMTVRAEWDKHGKAAGPIRNQTMIDAGKPDLVIAFAGGKGTADIVRRAKRAGIEVREIQ